VYIVLYHERNLTGEQVGDTGEHYVQIILQNKKRDGEDVFLPNRHFCCIHLPYILVNELLT